MASKAMGLCFFGGFASFFFGFICIYIYGFLVLFVMFLPRFPLRKGPRLPKLSEAKLRDLPQQTPYNVYLKYDSCNMAVGQNLSYLFGDGYHPTIVFFKGFLRVTGGTGF